MELTDVERRLLALHYLFPVPLNRLKTLYEIDPNLEKLSYIFGRTTSTILNITSKKQVNLKENLL